MMMRPRGNSRFAWCLAAAVSLSAGAARAQPSADQAATAEALFREARDLMAKGRHAEACPKFAASQKLDPGYGTQWNLADCLERSGRSASAWAAFREAADMAHKAGQAEREAKAVRRANDMEKKLERLVIAVKAPAPGLEVKRGGVSIDAAAWGTPLPVDPGKQVVEASAPGKKPFSAEVQTAGPGKSVTVEIPPLDDSPAPVEAAAPPAPGAPLAAPPPPVDDNEGASTRRTLSYVAGGVGLAGVVVGSVFGLSASSKWNEAQDDHCRTASLCDETGLELADDARRSATISTLGFVLGGVGLAAGVALFVTSRGHGDHAPVAARLTVVPVLVAGSSGGGVGLSGRF